MIRRIFLRRLLHGLGLAAAAAECVPAAPESVLHTDIPRLRTLYIRWRGEAGLVRGDWQDQWPGDDVCAVDATTGECEIWRAAGHPYYQVHAEPDRATLHRCTHTVRCGADSKAAEQVVEITRPVRRYPSLTAAAEAAEPMALLIVTGRYARDPVARPA